MQALIVLVSRDEILKLIKKCLKTVFSIKGYEIILDSVPTSKHSNFKHATIDEKQASAKYI